MADPDESFSFTRVLDLQGDLGVDPNANERIDGILESNLTDGTLIEVPSGTYRLGNFRASGQNIGVRGVGSTAPALLPDSTSKPWVSFDGNNLLFENFILGDGTQKLHAVHMHANGSWVCRDIIKRGRHVDSNAGFNIGCYNSGARGLLERCAAYGHDVGDDHDRGSVGVFVRKGHAGEVVIRDCHIEQFSDNGLYGSAPINGGNGVVGVERGLWLNNNEDGIRLASDGSYAYQTTIVQDGPAPRKYTSRRQRGVWIWGPGDNISIDDCDITIGSGAGTPGAGFVIGADAYGTGNTVTNCRVRQDTSRKAIHIHSSVTDGWSGSGNHITGSGNLTAPSAWVACSGSGCDEPRTTAREPTGGGDGGTVETDLLEIVSTSSDTMTEYRVVVDGEITELTSQEGEDTLSTDRTTTSGGVLGSSDGIRYTGCVQQFDVLSGPEPTLYRNGAQVSVSQVIDCPSPNPPTPSFDGSSNGLTVTVDASASSDPDGAIESYLWETSDGQTATGKTATFTFPSAGSYDITLTVTDTAGNSDVTTTTFSVESANQGPDAAFETVASGLRVTVDASASSDPDGSIQSYDWQTSDGQAASGETASFTFPSDGSYDITLTVMDDAGAVSTATTTVTVASAGDGGASKTAIAAAVALGLAAAAAIGRK